MLVPTGAAGAAALQELIARPDRALLGLDFDGTLSPIVADPASARPISGAREVIDRLAPHLDTLAIVTGRPAGVAADLLGFSADSTAGTASSTAGTASNVLVLGHYGLERRESDGRILTAVAPASEAAVDAVRERLPGLLDDVRAPSGTSIEDKGASVAVHVRRTADPTAAFEALRDPLSALARSNGLRLEPGRMVWELRPTGVDKGVAIEELARERGVATIAYVGDDLGDLAAFDAVERLRGSGVLGLTVCSGADAAAQLRARADVVVDGPGGVVRLLNDIADAVEKGKSRS